MTSVRLYPILSLALPAPAAGANGVEQGKTYSRLPDLRGEPVRCSTFSMPIRSCSQRAWPCLAEAGGQFQAAGRATSISAASSAARSTMTVWAVPVFLPVAPAMLPGTSFDGAMTLGAASHRTARLSAADHRQLAVRLHQYQCGHRAKPARPAQSNVFVAGIAINSSPDDLSSKAFAPTQFVLGLVRQAQVGSATKFVFVPETDSVIIGGKRYMLSVIELAT